MTKAERRRIAFLHASRLEAAYDLIAKVQEQWADCLQDVTCVPDMDERNMMRELLLDARLSVTKMHAAMLDKAREMDH